MYHKFEGGIIKVNCWEYKKCNKEINGLNVDAHGICPAATETCLNGEHDGQNAGRTCWIVAGTLCDSLTLG